MKKQKNKQVQNPFKIPDPEFAEQLKKYDNPIPSRGALLDFLTQQKQLYSLDKIATLIGIDNPEQLEALRRRLNAMINDGSLFINRKRAYGVRDKTDLVKGVVQAHADGFGFLVSAELEKDGFILPREMRKVMDGDTVLASIQPGRRKNKEEAVIVEILQRAHKTLVGKFFNKKGQGMVEPDNNAIYDIIIPSGSEATANDGDFVTVLINEYPNRHRPAFGEVIAILGQKLNSRLAMELTMASANLPHQWPDDFQRVVSYIPTAVTTDDITADVKDIRHLPLVTIDGEDARDFDDAVYAEKNNKGWRLIVAIADVSKYVPPNSELDKEAFKRGTSVYFPGKVIPMLPLELSNGICSLNPKVDRMCMVCDMQINSSGQIVSHIFYRAVMHSHARITYKQCWQYLDKQFKVNKWDDKVPQALDTMYALYKAMMLEKNQRGAISFNSTDVFISIDAQGQVASITPYTRNDAHKLIEAFMIAANISAAKFVAKHKVPAAYRVHDTPPLRKLTDLKAFLQSLGIKPNFSDPVGPKDFERIIKHIQGRDDVALIESVLLRSQALATYEAENGGHFGLALDYYAHFTSPIRRYPDLMIHRAIDYIINPKKPKKYIYSPQKAAEMCVQCSLNERRAETASRDVDARLKCMYMEQFIGEEMTGIISGVTHFGVFVTLDNIMVDGLIHMTSLPNDYYHHEPIQHKLVGERSGSVFQLADKLKIKVAAVAIDDRKIDFEFVEKL
ncbi:3'-to-5' exoribonuclease RNase R [hydrothermal vent metagenome]|uniref:exoribonuclease II n=2 Tax=hydrothermal vent metagenome TaxID=652676 RepID=A0A3B0VG29_9ZZZZ